MTIRYIVSFIFLSSLFLIACNSSTTKEKHPGFTPLENNFYYKRITIGDGKAKPQQGDFLTYFVLFKSENDSVLNFTKYNYKANLDTFTFKKSDFTGGLENLIGTMCEGDSSNFYLPALWLDEKMLKSPFPNYLKNSDELKVEIKLLDIKTEKELQGEKISYDLWTADMKWNEETILRDYIKKNNIAIEPDENGIYFILKTKGAGKKIKKGDKITLNYSAKMLDGSEFDNTNNWKEPFVFTMGTEGELIKGLELAIYKMCVGDRATIIIPSQLAFGEKGSSNGVVSPFKTVTFDLELKTIQ